MNDLQIDALVLEVTRRCNMSCAHCLRGDAQDKDMSLETVDKVINMASKISRVTFTGGEPTLNLPVVSHFFKLAVQKYGYAPAFFVATNGKENQVELMKVLTEAYLNSDEPDACSVAISKDIYHDADVGPDYLKALTFYSNIKEHSLYEDNPMWVQSKGRAYRNSIGNDIQLDDDSSSLPYIICRENSVPTIEMLYVTVSEECFADCDFSYEEMDQFPHCKLDNLCDGQKT